MVWGMTSSAGVEPIVRFHGNINASVYKEILCSHALPHLCKGQLKLQYLRKTMHLATKLKLLSFLE